MRYIDICLLDLGYRSREFWHFVWGKQMELNVENYDYSFMNNNNNNNCNNNIICLQKKTRKKNIQRSHRNTVSIVTVKLVSCQVVNSTKEL